MNKNSYLGKPFEAIIFTFIILAIFHIFLDEYAGFMDYSVEIRKYLLLAGFGFDLIFTIEFFFRLFISGKNRKTLSYIIKEGGLVDFVSSIPLLIFNSGSLVYITFFYGKSGAISAIAGLTILKTVKIIRITRFLRFFRALKIFGKLKSRYIITPSYVSFVTSISIIFIILSLIGFSLINRGVVKSKSLEVKKVLANYVEINNEADFKSLLKGTDSVLFIKKGNEYIYTSINYLFFKNYYFNDDYYKSNIGEYEVYFNSKDSKKIHCFINMMSFSMIMGIILGMIIFYRRYFNKNITAVLDVMIRGYKTMEYSTPVRINNKKKNFETYRLADQYNRKWLPIKRRIIEIKKKNI